MPRALFHSVVLSNRFLWSSCIAFLLAMAMPVIAIAQPCAAQVAAPQLLAAQDAAPTALPIRLLFVGDLMHHQAQDRLASTHRDGRLAGYTERWKLVAPMVSGVDLAVANLETAVTGGPVSGFPVFNAPVEFLQAAAATGFDVLSFANNHSMDGGFKGFSATFENIRAAGLQAAGDGSPLYVNVRGRTVGILSFTEFVNAGSGFRVPAGRHGPYLVRHDDQQSRGTLLETIRTMRGRADVVVVFVHWGVEYRYRPAVWASAWAAEMADAGADVIIGHHPHVVGPSEWVGAAAGRRAFVVYSLGNFFSGMTRDTTPYGYAVEITVESDGRIIPKMHTVWTYRDGIDGQWRTYRTVPAADLEADCAELVACPARAACLDRPTMPRTQAAPHECRRYSDAVKQLP